MRTALGDRGILDNLNGSTERTLGNRNLSTNGNRSTKVSIPIQERNHFPMGVPKLDFPNFNGSHPREWLRKCESFFQLYQIPAEQQMDLAKLHLEGQADLWYQSFKKDKGTISW